MTNKTFKNKELGIELTSFIDKQQNVWFKGKDVTQILGYKDSVNALKRHVSVGSLMSTCARNYIFETPAKTTLSLNRPRKCERTPR